MRESTIEKYLVKEIKKLGYLIRKTQFIGVVGCPDRLIMTPAITVWIETKAPDKAPKPHQARQHDLMRQNGQIVEIIDSKEGVDRLIYHIKDINSIYALKEMLDA